MILPVVVLLTAGCSPAPAVYRSVIKPPREENCEIQLLLVTQEEMRPGGKYGSTGEFEQIGSISLTRAGDTDPASPDVRSAVRERACAMGGEFVSLWGSTTIPNGMGVPYQVTNYIVWTKRASPASPATSGPQPF